MRALFIVILSLATSIHYVHAVAAPQNQYLDTIKAPIDSGKYYPCLNDLHNREFDFWIGTWDVYATGTSTLVGHSLIEKASGGCMILENWTGFKDEGKSINYVDSATGKWEQDWVGSGRSGVMRFINGAYKNSVMQFEGHSTDKNSKALTTKFSFFNQGPDKVRQLYETSADGIKWVTAYDFTYIRKK